MSGQSGHTSSQMSARRITRPASPQVPSGIRQADHPSGPAPGAVRDVEGKDADAKLRMRPGAMLGLGDRSRDPGRDRGAALIVVLALRDPGCPVDTGGAFRGVALVFVLVFGRRVTKPDASGPPEFTVTGAQARSDRARVLQRRGAWAGLVMAVLFAPIALVIPELPNLASTVRIDDFYSEHQQLMKIILCSVSVGLMAFLAFLAALTETLRREDAGAAVWLMLASALMFMTALAVALGLDAAAVLLHDRAGDETVWALHSAAFLLAAPAAGAGVAFFVGAAAASFSTTSLPRWLGWVAVAARVVNAGAVTGFFSLSGALNSGNGLIGGLAGPVLVWLVWIVAVSVSWLTPSPRARPVGADA